MEAGWAEQCVCVVAVVVVLVVVCTRARAIQRKSRPTTGKHRGTTEEPHRNHQEPMLKNTADETRDMNRSITPWTRGPANIVQWTRIGQTTVCVLLLLVVVLVCVVVVGVCTRARVINRTSRPTAGKHRGGPPRSSAMIKTANRTRTADGTRDPKRSNTPWTRGPATMSCFVLCGSRESGWGYVIGSAGICNHRRK